MTVVKAERITLPREKPACSSMGAAPGFADASAGCAMGMSPAGMSPAGMCSAGCCAAGACSGVMCSGAMCSPAFGAAGVMGLCAGSCCPSAGSATASMQNPVISCFMVLLLLGVWQRKYCYPLRRNEMQSDAKPAPTTMKGFTVSPPRWRQTKAVVSMPAFT